MNDLQQAQAKRLYFQSDLSKTEIAEMLGVPRRTLHYWIREKNWDRIKRSAAHMPSLLAENIYHIIARFSQQLMGEDRIARPITHKEADTLHKLVLTVNKLKTRNTLNESMEMFGLFMETVNQKSPQMAQDITPFVDDYISGRAATNIHQFRPDNMNSIGLIPKEEPNVTEEQLDMQDIMEWTEANNPLFDLENLKDPEEQQPAPTDTEDKNDEIPKQTDANTHATRTRESILEELRQLQQTLKRNTPHSPQTDEGIDSTTKLAA